MLLALLEGNVHVAVNGLEFACRKGISFCPSNLINLAYLYNVFPRAYSFALWVCSAFFEEAKVIGESCNPTSLGTKPIARNVDTKAKSYISSVI